MNGLPEPVIDPEWDTIIAELSQYCKETKQTARTTLKGGSLIVKPKVRRK